MAEKKVMKLASRGKRFGAAIIDALFPSIAYMIVMGILSANGIGTSSPQYGYGYGYGYGFNYDYGYNIGNRLSGTSAAIIAVLTFMLIVYIIVECVFFAKGKSIGKAMLGLQVVSSENGKPFRFWKMLFRECIVKSASGSVFALGYIWVLIDEKNRGWHDKILDSYVVDLKESEKINHRRSLAQAEARAKKEEIAEQVVAEPVTEEKPVVIPEVTIEEDDEAIEAEETEIVEATEESAE